MADDGRGTSPAAAVPAVYKCNDCGNHFYTEGMAVAGQCWSCADQPELAEDYADPSHVIKSAREETP